MKIFTFFEIRPLHMTWKTWAVLSWNNRLTCILVWMDSLTMLILHQLPLQLYVWNAIKRTEMPEPFNFRLKQLRNIYGVCLWDQTDYNSGLTLSSRPLLNPKPDLLTSDVRTEANVCPLGKNNKWHSDSLSISSSPRLNRSVKLLWITG